MQENAQNKLQQLKKVAKPLRILSLVAAIVVRWCWWRSC